MRMMHEACRLLYRLACVSQLTGVSTIESRIDVVFFARVGFIVSRGGRGYIASTHNVCRLLYCLCCVLQLWPFRQLRCVTRAVIIHCPGMIVRCDRHTIGTSSQIEDRMCKVQINVSIMMSSSKSPCMYNVFHQVRGYVVAS